jgi:hypothetical protein
VMDAQTANNRVGPGSDKKQINSLLRLAPFTVAVRGPPICGFCRRANSFALAGYDAAFSIRRRFRQLAGAGSNPGAGKASRGVLSSMICADSMASFAEAYTFVL